MGWRFRRTVRIAPGIRVNISKSGFSTSLGGRGASVNFGPRGVRQTVGMPGTGLSFSKLVTKGGGGGSSGGAGDRGSGCLGLVLILGLLVVLGQCLGGGGAAPDPQAPGGSAAAGASQGLFSTPGDGVTSIDADAVQAGAGAGAKAGIGAGETVYVQSSALNARAAPSTGAPVLEKLPQGAALQVVERSGDWMKVAQGATMFWIASRHAGSSRPGSTGATSSRPISTRSVRQSFAAAPAARPKKKKKRTSGSGISTGGCSCRGRNVCIGPRGGRYCITSGGNKRYGV
ncbi:MAG: DUF4236 domain-containing protein [Sphingobium sp.]